MKLIVDAETDKVLGASMCGPDAPEIMQVYYTFIDLLCVYYYYFFLMKSNHLRKWLMISWFLGCVFNF